MLAAASTCIVLAVAGVAGPARAAGSEQGLIGFNEIWLGQSVAEVDLTEYHTDDYYDPEVHYTTWRSWELLTGEEEYRFNYQDVDAQVHRIVIDFLHFDADGELITARARSSPW